MSLWRLEILRLTRTPRALVLGLVYLAFGLLGPVLAKYLPDIAKHAGGGGVTIVVPPPTPPDGVVQYTSQAGQTGLVVAVVVAAGALAFDAHRGLAAFSRTRVRSMWRLLRPRYVVMASAAAVASVVGTLAAWYATVVLLGSLPAGEVLGGAVCGAVYLAFAVAVVALAGSLARSVLGTVGVALAVLLLLPLVALVPALEAWWPSRLVGAPVELVHGTAFRDLLPSLVVTAALVPVLLAAAVRLLGRRES
jgi:ABC-2 type transport system permease protein